MTALDTTADESPGNWCPGGINRRERVQRPDGSWWTYDERWSSKVHRENTPAGPNVLVLRTWDRAKARRMAEVRWSAFYPGVPMPNGELAWRRREGEAWASWSSVEPGFRIGPSTGTETRSFPVVVFAAPIPGEKAPS